MILQTFFVSVSLGGKKLLEGVEDVPRLTKVKVSTQVSQAKAASVKRMSERRQRDLALRVFTTEKSSCRRFFDSRKQVVRKRDEFGVIPQFAVAISIDDGASRMHREVPHRNRPHARDCTLHNRLPHRLIVDVEADMDAEIAKGNLADNPVVDSLVHRSAMLPIG